MRTKNKKAMLMPKIFEYFGFIFYFYSNEHEPIHVHVIHGARESIFDLIMMDGELAELHVREKHGGRAAGGERQAHGRGFHP